MSQTDKLINTLFDTKLYVDSKDLSDPHANLKRQNK